MKLKKIIKIFIPTLILVILMVVLGEVRNDKNYNLNFSYISKKILVQSTSADEAYIFNLAIDFAQNNEFSHFKPFLTYIYNAIPFGNYDNSFVNLLKANYSYPGGEFILSSPYMSLGYIGIIVFSIIEYLILNYIIRNNNKIWYFYYLLILCTSFRITWYGITFIEMALLYIIPIIFLISELLKNGLQYYYKANLNNVEKEIIS